LPVRTRPFWRASAIPAPTKNPVLARGQAVWGFLRDRVSCASITPRTRTPSEPFSYTERAARSQCTPAAVPTVASQWASPSFRPRPGTPKGPPRPRKREGPHIRLKKKGSRTRRVIQEEILKANRPGRRVVDIILEMLANVEPFGPILNNFSPRNGRVNPSSAIPRRDQAINQAKAYVAPACGPGLHALGHHTRGRIGNSMGA